MQIIIIDAWSNLGLAGPGEGLIRCIKEVSKQVDNGNHNYGEQTKLLCFAIASAVSTLYLYYGITLKFSVWSCTIFCESVCIN